MFAGFKMNLENKDLLCKDDICEGTDDKYYRIGRRIFESDVESSRKNLDKYLSPQGILSAVEIQEDWFPAVDADIFISHSHKDETLAIRFAGWLWDEFKIRAFIDSCVWGYADDLLKELDEKYCKADKYGYYDYQKRNQSTGHVHMLLNGALMQMIDSTECLVFLNTPNSISSSDVGDHNLTSSPWIYSELMITKIVRRKLQYEEMKKSAHFEHFALKIEYPAEMENLVALTVSDILKAGTMPSASSKRKREGSNLLRKLYYNLGIISR